MSKKTYTKIAVSNQWEHLEYTLANEDETELGGPILKPGDELVIRWPSGRITNQKLQGREKHFTYSDHGHDQSGTTTELYLENRDVAKGITYTITDFSKLLVRRLD